MACNSNTCAVCGADIDPANPAAFSNYQNQTYCFCCDQCKEEFDANPQLYKTQQAA